MVKTSPFLVVQPSVHLPDLFLLVLSPVSAVPAAAIRAEEDLYRRLLYAL
jgi:hypothetical protein